MRVSYSQRGPLTMCRSPSIPSSHQNSSPNLHAHAHQLEQQIKQLSKQARQNKSTIEDLECRRKFFKKICDKQKEKLASVDVQTIKEEYEAELTELRLQKDRLQEMVDHIHQDFQHNTAASIQIATNLSHNKTFLQRSLLQLNTENTLYRELLSKKLESVQNQKTLLLQNEQLINQKQRTQEQFESVCEQLRKWEATV